MCAHQRALFMNFTSNCGANLYFRNSFTFKCDNVVRAHIAKHSLHNKKFVYISVTQIVYFFFFLRYEKLQNIRFLNYSARRTEVVCSARKLRFISSLTFSPYIYKCMHVAMLILDCQTCH